MKRLLMILCAMLLVSVLSGVGNASLVTIVEHSAWYNYAVLPETTPLFSYSDSTVWENAGYDSFNWDSASWELKQAGFTTNSLSGWNHTLWGADTDLALQKSFHLDGVLTNLTLKVSVDNGFILFINGTQVAKEQRSGKATIWDYTLSIDPSVFIQGDNIIEVLAEDHGVYTMFNMELTGDIASVPIPGAIWLLGSGLIGIVGIRRKYKK